MVNASTCGNSWTSHWVYLREDMSLLEYLIAKYLLVLFVQLDHQTYDIQKKSAVEESYENHCERSLGLDMFHNILVCSYG